MKKMPLLPYHRIFYNEWKINPHNYNYNIVFDQTVDRNLNLFKFKGALYRFVSEHLLLNSHIKQINNQLYWIKNEMDVQIQHFPLNTYKEKDIRKFVSITFNLEIGPLYRFAIFENSNGTYRLLIVMHHIIIDGNNFTNFIQEINNYYNLDFYKSKFSLQIQNNNILDKIKFINNTLSLNRSKNQQFWHKEISNARAVDLQFIKSNPVNLSARNITCKTKSIYFDFEEETLEYLEIIKAKYDISSYLYSITIVAILLHKYTTEKTLTIGFPININKDTNLFYGAMVNTNIITYNFSNSTTLSSLIAQTNKFISKLKDQQNNHNLYPINEVLKNKEKLLDIFFVKTSFKREKFTFNGIKTLNVNDKFDMDLSGILVFEQDFKKPICYRVKYNSLKVDEVILNNFIKHYKNLFKIVLNDLSIGKSHKLIKDYQILSTSDYKQLLYKNNMTTTPYSYNKTVQQLFEEQVERTPNNISISYKGITLTYKELNQAANQLAHYLKLQYKTKVNEIIGLFLSRSQYMIISILAILKAGSAYLPLDIDYPTNRLLFILKDAKLKLIITNKLFYEKIENIVKNLPKRVSSKPNLLTLDEDNIQKLIANYSHNNLNTTMNSNSLAYIIYTSGTTGNPKGVMIEHKSLVNRLEWMNSTYPLSEKDKILQKTSYSFDVSVWELIWAILYGASIVFAEPEKHKDPIYLINIIQNQKISIIHFVPSMLSIFMDYLRNLPSNPINSLRHIFCSGEALSAKVVNRVYSALPTVLVHNLYGPTETCIDVLYYDCPSKIKSMFIGKPINNTKAYILDTNIQFSPIGAIGELHISGIGLARGYLNQPALTQERFIINPFQTRKEKKFGINDRLYKTGDLARCLPDGNIEYSGRIDSQVKINGYRIELNEIENIINNYKGIEQSIVTTSKDNTKLGQYLICYYIAEKNLEDNQLTEYLLEYIPYYMLPRFFIPIKKLPTTINGKMDIRLLPEPQLIKGKYYPPNNIIESKLCNIHAKILKLNTNVLSIKDDFFKLGIDSILAIRLATEINKAFSSNITVKDIYKLKNIERIAKFLSNKIYHKEIEYKYIPFSLVNTESSNDNSLIEDTYPASHLQLGMLFESSLSNDGIYHDVFYYQINVPFYKAKFLKVWNNLIIKHQLLRAKFLFDDAAGWKVVISKSLKAKCKVYVNDSLKDIIEKEKLNKFDFEKTGLFRLIVNKHIDTFDLIFSFHHAIADGWSIASLINEFIQAYVWNNPINNNCNNLSYGEFVYNEQIALKNKKSIAFWDKYLCNVELVHVKWKFDYKEMQPKNMLVSSFNLTITEVQILEAIANKNSVSIDTIFLYAYLKVLSFFYNNEKVLIGLVTNNRLEKDNGTELFGLFLNTIPFKFCISNKNTINQEIKALFKKKIEISQYKNVPYGYLKSKFKKEFYEFAFNFVHYHVLKNSIKNITKIGGYEKTNIPFLLTIYQNLQGEFNIEFKVHSNFIDEDYLNYFASYFKQALSNILINNNKSYQIALSETDYKKIVEKWSSPYKNKISTLTITQAFELQAIKFPNNIAVNSDGFIISYQELNYKANQLAHFLQINYHIKPNELIGICLLKNEYLIISMLAILKLGAAYVPLKDNYPNFRINQIIQDTQSKLIITNQIYTEKFKTIFKEQNLNISSLIIDNFNIQAILRDFSCSNPQINANSNNLACVIYTSGTTGNPKGVMVEHKGIVSLVKDTNYIRILPTDSFLQLSDTAFDAAAFEIWGALLNGAKIFLQLDIFKMYSNINNFKKFILKNKISILWLTKTMFDQIYSYDNKVFKSLNYLLVGGETLNYSLVKDLICSYNKPANFINGYGPTENTTFSCTLNVDQEMIKSNNSIPIGKPITNRSSYILNKEFLLLPIGVIGELYVSGIGLARGYLNQPIITQEKFIINPFQTEKEKQLGINDKLYKTGDSARWLPDGNLEYIGRVDSQVKVNGYRIELSEIENKIVNYKEVKQAAIIVKENIDDKSLLSHKHLVAYYTSSSKLDENLLLSKLAMELPNYMLPNFFIKVNNIPLTINGKLDKNSLPLPEFINKNNYIPPRNNLELIICEAYNQTLNLPEQQISIDDDFFKLGGNSILVIRLVAKLQHNFKINVNDIFKLRSPAKIASSIKFAKNNLKNRLNKVKVFYKKLLNNKKQDFGLMQEKNYQYFKEIKNINFSLRPKQINNVLLTGGTGYLGCNILYQLLKFTEYKVYLLVKNNKFDNPYIKLNNKFKFYFNIDLEIYQDRIFVLPSDIAKNNLDLDDIQYQQLVTSIDSIIHCAALVKHYGYYEEFFLTNVSATVNLLELCRRTRLKDFHYISTIGIFMEGYVKNYSYYVFNENDNVDILENRNNFYLDTKFKGELTVINYRELGVNGNIYRVGNLSMNSTNYRNQENIEENAFFIRLKTMVKLGTIPKELSNVEISPVDYTALAIIKIFEQSELNNQTYHIFNPHEANLLKLLLPYKELDVIMSNMESFIDSILLKMQINNIDNQELELFMLHQLWLKEINLKNVTKIRILQNKTNLILKKLGFKWAPITSGMLTDIINQIKRG